MTMIRDFDAAIPGNVLTVLNTLERSGRQAWVVGGCVRDVLMGREPQDWDVCTSALPEETMAAFDDKADVTVIPTGLKHGTVTVVVNGKTVEVTTWRIDGDYQDGRHPEKVEFTRSLTEDLARRDFTMNAIAFSPSRGLKDPYNGRKDIGDCMIRCVGEPEKRFAEDALRILRALRFRSVLGFSLETDTARAVRSCRHLLEKVSKERVSTELSKLLLGSDADSALNSYHEVLAVCAPGICPASVSALPENLCIRLAAVFPENTEQALRNLKYDGHTVASASALARLMKQAPPEEPAAVRRLLHREGLEVTELYYAARGCGYQLAAVLRENPCWSLQQLALKGGDLIRMGMEPGPQVGRILGEMLEKVIDGELENRSEILLDYARERGYIR
ncbi:MAG: CCA tRNA nucleotidyltransferase [Emergencia sp.]